MAKKILVVDDDKTIVKMIESRLKSEGYEVTVAYDGDEGMRKVQAKVPDLVVLDVIMPGMDGTEMGAKLRENGATKDIPIIFLTGILDKAEADMRHHMMSDAYLLAKPFDGHELLEMIKKILG